MIHESEIQELLRANLQTIKLHRRVAAFEKSKHRIMDYIWRREVAKALLNAAQEMKARLLPRDKPMDFRLSPKFYATPQTTIGTIR